MTESRPAKVEWDVVLPCSCGKYEPHVHSYEFIQSEGDPVPVEIRTT